MKTRIFLFVAILAATFSAVSCHTKDDPEVPPTHLQIGDAIPQFSVTTLSGYDVSTETLAGKEAVIILFDSTCPDCEPKVRLMQLAYIKAMKKINFIAIARDEDEKTIRKYWRKNGYTMPVAAPGERTIYNLFDRGSQSGVPQIYYVTEDGLVQAYLDCNEINVGSTGISVDELDNLSGHSESMQF